jgi:hypothetical protein
MREAILNALTASGVRGERPADADIDQHVADAPTGAFGMHYQAAPHAEDKLVRCVRAIWDAIVDIRPDSPTYCEWVGVELNESDGRMLLVPKALPMVRHAHERRGRRIRSRRSTPAAGAAPDMMIPRSA